MEAIDFTKFSRRNKMYAGANGNKICVMYEGTPYMLKFPSMAKRNKDMSYSNSCFSEYLGCRIYESIGIPVQKTLIRYPYGHHHACTCVRLRKQPLSPGG